MRDFVKNLSTVVLSASVGATVAAIPVLGVHKAIKDGIKEGFDKCNFKLSYDMASESIADIDGIPGTSHQDWMTAYKEALDKNYDVHLSNPIRELTQDELIKIWKFYS